MANKGCFPRKLHQLYDREWLEREYVLRNRTARDIATSLGCASSCVSVAIRRVGLTPRPQSPWRIDADGRECTKCSGYQLWAEFYPAAKTHPGGRMSSCRTCEKGRPRYQARFDQLAKFGITPAEYAWLLAQQGGVCALCLRAEVRSDRRYPEIVWSLAVDHDHRHCPKNRACKLCIRGLLCASCNTMLGRVEQAGEPLVLRFSDYLGSRPFLGEGVVLMQPYSEPLSRDRGLRGTGVLVTNRLIRNL